VIESTLDVALRSEDDKESRAAYAGGHRSTSLSGEPSECEPWGLSASN
jgi:hypothetical protein